MTGDGEGRRLPRHAIVGAIPVGLVLFLYGGCQDVSVGSLQVTVGDSSGVSITTITGSVADLPLWTLAEPPELVISGSYPPFFGLVGNVAWLSDGRIVIVDRQADQIHLFGSDGRYVGLLGDKGDGPGEFQNVTEISTGPADSIYAYDRRHRRLSVLHPDAGFARSVDFLSVGDRPNVLDAWALRPDRLVTYASAYPPGEVTGPFPRRIPRDVLLTLYDGPGSLLAGPLVFPGGYSAALEDGSDAGVPFSNAPAIAVGSGRVVYGSGVEYEITVRNADFEHRSGVRWPRPPEPITESEVAAVRETIVRTYTELAFEELATRLAEGMFAENMIPPSRPSLGRVFVDDAGRIWVSRFEPRAFGWDAPREWHVLDESGRPIGRVTLPEDRELAAVARDKILLITSDSLDVQSIESWQVNSPPS